VISKAGFWTETLSSRIGSIARERKEASRSCSPLVHRIADAWIRRGGRDLPSASVFGAGPVFRLVLPVFPRAGREIFCNK
jgi:hypothetical protein